MLWTALVERRVDKLFDAALRPDAEVRNELLRPSGALGNYAVKVRLAYLFGWIGKEIFNDLILVGRIRNRFAHAIEAKDFSDQQISAWLRNMNAFRMLPELLERAKRSATEKPNAVSTVAVHVLEDALQGDHMGFRWCIDQMIHYLDKAHANMVKNLASLPGGWMVGEESPPEVRAANEARAVPSDRSRDDEG